MLVEVHLPADDLQHVPGIARRLESLGCDGLTTSELEHDPFLPLLPAALATDRVSLGTAVAIAFPRSPMVTALTSWDLQRASKGRFILGLGTQVKGHNERRYSVPWSGPAQPRLREYVGAVKAIWDTWQHGTPLDFHGRYYSHTLMTPEFNPGPLLEGPPKIVISAVGPYMARLAGEICDGVRLHSFCTPRYAREVIWPELVAGAQRVGRDPKTLIVTAGGFIAAGSTPAEVERNREAARRRVAFYGSTRTYHGVFNIHGWSEIGPRLHELSLKGQWDRMAALVPDEVLDQFVLSGTYEDLAVRIRERFGAICNRVNLTIPVDTSEQNQGIKLVIEGLHAADNAG